MTDQDTPAIAAGEAAPDPAEAMWQEATAAERDKKTPDEPAATEAADEAAPDAPEAPEPAAEEDIWATAPEPLRTAYKALEEQYDKRNKQVSGQTRKIKELSRTIRQRDAAPPPDRTRIDAALAEVEDYPDLAGAMRKIAEPIYEHFEQAGAANEAARVEDLVEQANLLEDDHPGWFDLVTNTKKAEFAAFVADDDQPAWVAKAYAANEKDVTDAAQAARLITAFKDTLGTPPAADPPATRTSDIKRDRQLSGLSTPPPRGGATTSSLPATADPEAIWKEAARKERQAQA